MNQTHKIKIKFPQWWSRDTLKLFKKKKTPHIIKKKN